MGFKERRSAEKVALRKRILDVAQAIFHEEGSWQGVTMRKIASDIQYSLPTIYEYFENKDALLKALQARGFIILCDAIANKLLNTASNPVVVLSTIVSAHWEFAWDYPDLYRIMFNEKISRHDHIESIAFIRTTIHKALKGLILDKPDELYDDKIDSIRGIMHGFIMLALTRTMERDRAFRLMMDVFECSISERIVYE